MNLTAWMLPSWGNHQLDKQHDNQAFMRCTTHSLTVPPAALRSLLSQRNQYLTMIKLDVAYIGCKGLAKFTKGAETIHDFCWASAAESCEWGGVDGCVAAEPKHRSNMCVPCRQRPLPRKQNFSTFCPTVMSNTRHMTHSIFLINAFTLFLLLFSRLHHCHLQHDSV